MVNEIVWSDNAQKTFDGVIDYLQKEWTEKEIIKFIRLVNAKFEVLRTFPKIGVLIKKNIYVTIINKKVSLFYKYSSTKKEVILILFWDTQQNPKALKLK